MKRLRAILLVVLLLSVGTVAVVILWQAKPFSSGPLSLPDGTTVRIVAVTHGTNHECGTLLARWVRRLPPRGQQLATAAFGLNASAYSGYFGFEPEVVVWLHRETNSIASPNPPSRIIAWLADESGFTSGNAGLSPSDNPSIVGLIFSAVPRRDESISLHFFGRYANGSTNLGSLRFKNPFMGTYPQWEPEELPSTKRAGDVEVILTRFATGLGSRTRLRKFGDGEQELKLDTNREEGRNYSICLAQARSLASKEEVWRVADVVLSDATGNRIEARMHANWDEVGVGAFEFDHGLWTNEGAWKLDFELNRTTGFRPEEILTFHKVPLGELDVTNQIGWTSNLLGGSVTLKNIVRRRPVDEARGWGTEPSTIEVTQRFPTNVFLNFLKMTLDTGRTNAWHPGERGYWMRSDSYRIDRFPDIPLEVKTADLSFSVQTSRWVQFTVKPEVGTTRLKLPTSR